MGTFEFRTDSKLHKTEFYALLAAIFFLPLLEAPKNICLLAFLVCWIINRARAKDFGGKISIIDITTLLLVSSGYITAFFTELQGKEWSGPNNLLLIGLVLILIYRSSYSSSQLRAIVITVIISTVIATLEGYYQLYTATECAPCKIELHSVGHVNHSAIYILLAFGASFSYMLSFWKQSSIKFKTTIILTTIFFAVTCLMTESRAAAGGVFIVATVLTLAFIPANKKLALIIISVIVIAIGLSITARPISVDRLINTPHKNEMSPREKIRNSSLIAWKKHPAFGIGMKNYSLVTLDKVKEWSQELGIQYVAKHHLYHHHAHNLYLNTAVEKGTLGLITLVTFLLTIMLAIIKSFPGSKGLAEDWLFWGAASSAFITTTAIGLVNTTLHHEHGLLTVILFACLLCSKKGSLTSTKTSKLDSNYA